MIEAFSVAIAIRLNDYTNRALRDMVHNFAATDAQAAKLQKTINSITADAMKGFLMVAAGSALFSAFKAPLEAASKWQVAVNKFKAFGMSDYMNAQAQNFAKNTKVMGVSMTEMMEVFGTAQAIFRDSGTLEHALTAAPVMAKIKVLSEHLYGEAGGAKAANFNDMLRVVELRGGINDSETFKKQSDMLWKTIATSHNTVDATQYMQFLRRAKTSGNMLSDTALFQQLEPIIQELKGATAGTSLSTAYNRVQLGMGLSGVAGKEMVKLGLLNPKMVEFNKLGNFKRFKGGTSPLLEGQQQASAPIDWYWNVLMPLYQKKGIVADATKIAEKGSKEYDKVNKENALIFGATGGNFFNIVYRQRDAIYRGQKMATQAQGVDDSLHMVRKNWRMLKKDAAAKWENFLTKLGDVLLPKATKLFEMFNNGLEKLGNFVGRNQGLVEKLGYALGGLATMLAFSGTVFLLKAAFSGLRLALEMGGMLGNLQVLGKVIGMGEAGGAIGIGALAGNLALFATRMTLIGLAIWGVWKYWDKIENSKLFQWAFNDKDILQGINEERKLTKQAENEAFLKTPWGRMFHDYFGYLPNSPDTDAGKAAEKHRLDRLVRERKANPLFKSGAEQFPGFFGSIGSGISYIFNHFVKSLENTVSPLDLFTTRIMDLPKDLMSLDYAVQNLWQSFDSANRKLNNEIDEMIKRSREPKLQKESHVHKIYLNGREIAVALGGELSDQLNRALGSSGVDLRRAAPSAAFVG